MSSTTLTSWALLAWQTLQDEGIDPRPIFEKAKLDPAKLGDGNARYAVENLYKMWEGIALLGDPLIGVKIGQNWSPTTFHALGFAWLASTSLKEALTRICRYGKLVNNSLEGSLADEGAWFRFTLQLEEFEGPVKLHTLAADAANAAMIKMCRLLCGEGFSPLEIQAKRGPSPGTKMLEELFRRPISYNNQFAYWKIDRFETERRVKAGNAELARLNEDIAAKALSRVVKDDIGAQTRLYISESLPSGEFDEEHLAEKLGMSVRSLQRKLGASNLTFSGLVNQVREHLALHYINESQLSISEIGYLLGYAEQASFTRAFKRWTGKNPTQYRGSLENVGNS